MKDEEIKNLEPFVVTDKYTSANNDRERGKIYY